MSDPLLAAGCLWLAWAALWWLASLRVEKTRSSESFAQRLRHLLPSAAALWLLFSPQAEALSPVVAARCARWWGVALTAAGFSLAVWARWHIGRYWSGFIALKEGHRLIRTGPYARVRHPIYTGILLAACGSALANGRWTGLAAAALFVLVYRAKAAREESLLREAFGAEYDRYRAETGFLLPRL